MRTSEELKKDLADLKAQFHARAEELGRAIAQEHVAALTFFPTHLQAAKPEGKKAAAPKAVPPARSLGKPFTPVPKPSRARRPAVEIEEWIPNTRARRVPKFVIQMTNGLKTKKEIVAKYGDAAVFKRSDLNGTPPLQAGM